MLEKLVFNLEHLGWYALRPCPWIIATCSRQPLAATCSHRRMLKIFRCFPAATCSHLQPLAAICSQQPLAATCSHLQPSCSHLQPLAPSSHQMVEICFQKAPGQDLAKNGRFPMIPEEKFNSRPRGRKMAEICFQKAPLQPLAATCSHLSSHLPPLAAICSQQPLAATAATCSHLSSHSSSHLQPLAATCSQQTLAATCSHLLPPENVENSPVPSTGECCKFSGEKLLVGIGPSGCKWLLLPNSKYASYARSLAFLLYTACLRHILVKPYNWFEPSISAVYILYTAHLGQALELIWKQHVCCIHLVYGSPWSSPRTYLKAACLLHTASIRLILVKPP